MNLHGVPLLYRLCIFECCAKLAAKRTKLSRGSWRDDTTGAGRKGTGRTPSGTAGRGAACNAVQRSGLRPGRGGGRNTRNNLGGHQNRPGESNRMHHVLRRAALVHILARPERTQESVAHEWVRELCCDRRIQTTMSPKFIYQPRPAEAWQARAEQTAEGKLRLIAGGKPTRPK